MREKQVELKRYDPLPKAEIAAAALTLLGRKGDYFEGPDADYLEELLGNSQWFGGAKPSQADAKALKLLKKRLPDPKLQPNLYGWAAMARKFNKEDRAKWEAGKLKLPERAEKAPK